jgi:hypothetical protein
VFHRAEATADESGYRKRKRRSELKQMIIILGCDHCLQEPVKTMGFWAGIEQTPKARRQREGFQKVIEELIQKYHCAFIGEETNHGQRTPAVVISEKWGTSLPKH